MVALGLQTNIKGMLTLGIKPLIIGTWFCVSIEGTGSYLAENSNKMHCIMEIPSMEVIKEFMMQPENQEAMKNAGVKMEGREMIPLAD